MSDETKKPESDSEPQAEISTEEKPEDAAEESPEESKQEDDEGCASAEGEIPPIDFSTFIFSLSTQAMVLMGEIKDPRLPEAEVDLPAAKQTIDIVAMLEEKTKGNLSEAEAGLMSNLLYDLRTRYVKTLGKQKA